ncbi:DinB family protein [Virgibacillus flavescens]|uniref:DinB family protein n=1 Tax=Virgibacillus flavescens TaxID=1611422 RepID=UPI003D33376D
MKQRQEIFFNQLESFRDYLLKVADVTETEAEAIPKGFRNNIRWNLGHVYTEQYMWIKTLINEEVDVPEQFEEWFGWDTSPEKFTSETPSLLELRALLKGQLPKIKQAYGDRLEEAFPPTEIRGMTTIEQVLLWTSFHEGMHLQAIQDIKKCLHAE